jgi:hypothetical protein
MDGPTEELAVNVGSANPSESNNLERSGTTTHDTDIPSPSRQRHRHRHRHHHHRRRHGVRSGDIRYEKTLLHFSAAHILLGIICVLLQVFKQKFLNLGYFIFFVL